MESRRAIKTAIGKIILIGEHAVVYGEPSIAIPFPGVSIKTTICETIGPVILECYYYRGRLSDSPKAVLGLKKVIEGVTESFNEKLENFSIHIASTIPPARGMGSSAAVAISTIRALYEFFNRTLTENELLKWAHESEKVVHGSPSGIDAAVVGGERPLYYRKGMPFVSFKINLDAYLVVGDTGREGQTREAVEGVRQFIESKPDEGMELIKELGNLTRLARKSIEDKDAEKLGKAMFKAHIILDKLGVSNDKLNFLVSKALDCGALGAKLTGGGRGGCMIALADDRKKANYISQCLLSSGAKNTWINRLGDDLVGS